MTIVTAGLAVGIAVAAVTVRYLSAQLYAVDPADARIFAGVAGAFALVALVACLAPSWRASKLDPLRALRGG